MMSSDGKCDTCGKPLGKLWWQDVPNRGTLCSPCHENWSQAKARGPIVETLQPMAKRLTWWESFLSWLGFRRA